MKNIELGLLFGYGLTLNNVPEGMVEKLNESCKKFLENEKNKLQLIQALDKETEVNPLKLN